MESRLHATPDLAAHGCGTGDIRGRPFWVQGLELNEKEE